MGKIKIHDIELEEEEAAELIEKGKDYTKKTQDLSEKEKLVETNISRVGKYLELDEYLARNPELSDRIKKMVDSHVKGKYSPANNLSNIAPKKPASNNYTNAGNSMYYTGDDTQDIEESQSEGPRYLTEEEFEKRIKERDHIKDMESNQKNIQSALTKQYEDLREKGYTEEEMKKVVMHAQKSNVWLTTATKELVFDGVLPDRLKKKPEDTEHKNQLLKGQPAAGFELPDPEKDLVKYGNDPFEWLRNNPEKLYK